ncbi:MAG TPA: Hsp20/alpha crystallin family protein [Syntrophorhabdaceae bacterium]|nr:Hsp20/alpha crystallin family protein [Syntrophorhabdaceae bacterium]
MLWTEGFGTFGQGLDPWFEFRRIENEMNRILSRYASPSSGEFPAVNIWAGEDLAVVTTEIPGIDAKTMEISVTGKTLSLRGSREPEESKEGESYHRRERWYGQFTKTLELPFTVEGDKVEARFSKGVLTIRLPRAEAEKPKKINVKSA